MRMIFEQDDDEDFFEVVLSHDDLDKLRREGNVHMDFAHGLFGTRNLNLFIRKETNSEERK